MTQPNARKLRQQAEATRRGLLKPARVTEVKIEDGKLVRREIDPAEWQQAQARKNRPGKPRR